MISNELSMELLQSIVSGASLGSLNCNSGFVSIFNNAAAFVELLTDQTDLHHTASLPK